MFERNNSVPLPSFLQAERQARIERRLVIKTYALGTMRMFAMWLRAFGVWGIRLASDLAAKRALRSAMRELHQLDDRMLKDIGVSRGEIEFCGAQRIEHTRDPRTASARLEQRCDTAADRLVVRSRA